MNRVYILIGSAGKPALKEAPTASLADALHVTCLLSIEANNGPLLSSHVHMARNDVQMNNQQNLQNLFS